MPSPLMQQISQAIQTKIDALRASEAIPAWQFRIIPTAERRPALDPAWLSEAAGWETVQNSKSWSSADGQACFITTVDAPAAVDGIPLSGARLNLEFLLTIGAAIYIDGVEKYREPSWSDTRAIALEISPSFQPGPFSLAIVCNAQDGFGFLLMAALRFSTLEEVIFQLDLLRAQLAFTHFLANDGKQPSPAKQTRWESAANRLNLAALVAGDWTQWDASAGACLDQLAPFADEAKTYTAHLAAHSHIDMNWLWPYAETVDVCRRDFSAVDSLMTRYPEFHFSQSQAATYSAMQQDYPELFQRIQARVAEGRWDVTASTWVEGDLNLAAGETLVRQLLHARRYIRQHFGKDPLICWEPDTFGHVATLPQLLKQCGIEYYYFCRAGKRHPLFWWEGLDGSRVLAVQDPRGYGGVMAPANVADSVIDFATRYATQRGLFVYGVGDHGGGATAADLDAARRMDASPLMPVCRPSSAVDFYQQAQAEAKNVPVVRGELNTVFEGCYSSHGDIKRLNRQSENRLLSAESAAALAALQAGAAAVDLGEAWRALCFHQFHDILCGCAIGVTYREAAEKLGAALNQADQAAQAGLTGLAAALDTGADEGLRLVVFNPLGWARTDLARIPLKEITGAIPAALVDDAGTPIAVQVSGDALLFIAQDVPALGCRVYRPADTAPTGGVTASPDGALENGRLRLHVHPASGAVDSLVDVAAGRDIAGPWGGWGPEAKVLSGALNQLQIWWEQPHPMSAWNIGDITRVDHLVTGAAVKVVEVGAVRGVIEVRRSFLHSSLVQRISLYNGLDRIDFETEVDWHERGSAHADAPMLRAAFTPYFEHTRATYEVAFAALERPADGREVPALRWADLSDTNGAYGLSLLNNGKYGHSAQGNTLGLTLVRASYEPDNNPDEGLHRFTYALYPHAGDWRAAGSIQRAAGLNQPLLVQSATAHSGSLKPGQPGVTLESASALVSAVKLAEDQPANGQAVIVRLYEAHGKATEAVLRPGWAFTRAEEVNPLEETAVPLAVVGGGVRLTLTPHEVKTIRFQ